MPADMVDVLGFWTDNEDEQVTASHPLERICRGSD
jgi:hypothetical protein